MYLVDGNRRVATINGAECKLCEHHLCSFLPDRHKACSHSFRQLLRGDRLSVDDGSCLRFWVVLSGTAALCTTLADGRRQIVELETPGDLRVRPDVRNRRRSGHLDRGAVTTA